MADDILSYSSEKKGIVTPNITVEEQSSEIISLRPTSFKEYIGQTDTVETLKIAIQAAKMRNESLDHILLHGPPGLGKTTVSHIIANEMGKDLTVTSGPTLEFDKGIHARSHRYQLKQFVLLGATTRVGLLSSPLRDRFGIFRTLDFYSIDQLLIIIKRSAAILNTIVSDNGAVELAKRSRGTPRIANRLLKRVRDYSQVKSDGKITKANVKAALELEGIDDLGLTSLDQNYLKTIINYYKGGPVGIEAISATLQEETDTLVDVVEPFLLKIGLVLRTQSGRKASSKAYKHLNINRHGQSGMGNNHNTLNGRNQN
jgi:holliday junction DNA helicase RuvB